MIESPMKKEEDNMINTIMNLEKKQRDILRESVSTMRQAWQEQELPEEITPNEETEQNIIKQTPKPKIVCPNLYNNTIAARSQAAIKPQINIDNDLLEAIRAENESVRSNRKIEPIPKIPMTSKAANEKKDGMSALLDKIKGFNKSKINKLLKILDSIENNVEPNIPRSVPQLNKATPLKKEPQKLKTKKNELVFRIVSTWSHPHVVGLTEIELYDNKGNKMVTPIMARNLGSGPSQPITKLVNGKIYINDEKLMWIAYLPLPPKFVELVFTLPDDFSTLGGLSVWNYNKSSLDSVKGVRGAEVLLNGNMIWSGTIKRGMGRINEDYSTEIPLCNSVEVFKNKQRSINNEVGASMPKDLLKVKQQIEESNNRPVSVPVWLLNEDSKYREEKTESSNSKLTSKKIEDVKAIADLPLSKPGHSRERVNKLQGRKGFASKFTEARSIASRGTVDSQSSNQRDVSIERKLDDLRYFEASKPHRMLQKLPKPKKLPNTSNKSFQKNPVQSQGQKDILDLFIERHELSEEKKEVTTYDSLKKLYESSTSFTIPNKPKGQLLTFEILSTWSDPYYVGLAGIEVFTAEGFPLKIHPSKITAEPKDINVLPEYGSDPRTIDKLVDGVYFTRDDLHVWLAPYNPGQRHYITFDLGIPTTISMIRLWNYNKSRIHSERGIKKLIITFDSSPIFIGEIRKAPGTLMNIQECCEVLLFTNSQTVIEQIAAQDWIEKVEIESECKEPSIIERPPTASKGQIFERPLTAAITKNSIKAQIEAKDKELALLQASELKKGVIKQSVYGSAIEICILDTWGDLFYTGLTGLYIYNEKGEEIELDVEKIEANPKDLNSIPGYSGDYRTIDKLIDKHNCTTDDEHMWLIPFNKGKRHSLTINLGKKEYIGGLKFYNYNKAVEDTYRGVKTVTISVDSKLVTPKRGITIKKAPGNANYDFGHFIALPFLQGWNNREIANYSKHQHIPLLQEYYTPHLPTGFTFDFILYSTYGDMHYIGLNGLEMYDLLGRPLLQQSQRVAHEVYAFPSSVNKIEGLEGDIRTIDKLTDGYNVTLDDRHMWLTSLKNTKVYAVTNREVAKIPNIITITFEDQVAISGIRLWNYSKTVERGVQELGIFCDGKLIYRVNLLIIFRDQ